MSNSNNNSPTPATSTSDGTWRLSVTQNYRSEEVSNISKVLASLEPSATPESKLMLASRFEESCFTAASSLEEYRTKISKRLKKMKKQYTKAKAKETGQTNPETIEKKQKEDVKNMERNFSKKYGAHLMDVVKYGPKTKQILNDYGKNENETDRRRKESVQHGIDRAISWAVELNLVPEGNKNGFKEKNTSTNPIGDTHAYFIKMKDGLERHLPTIRSYVIKYTQGDLFFAEKLVDVEDILVSQPQSALIGKGLSRDVNLVMQKEGIDLNAAVAASAISNGSSTHLRKGTPSTTTTPTPSSSDPTNISTTIQNIQKLLEKLRAVIPIPKHADEERDACVKYIDKIRISCNVVLMYLSLPDTGAKMKVRGCLRKAHETAIESYEYISKHYAPLTNNKRRKVQPESREGISTSSIEVNGTSSASSPAANVVQLEDAWNKVMEYSKDAPAVNSTTVDSASAIPGMNDQKPRPFVIRSRVLLTPGRNPPSNLVPALKRKRAELCRSDSSGCMSLKLNFGEAFEMQIFFVPLLVTIRPIIQTPKSTTSKQEEDKSVGDETTQSAGDDKDSQQDVSPFFRDVVHGGLATWKSPLQVLDQYYSSSKGKTTGSSDEQLQILGVSGSMKSVGPLVSQQLDYASAQATRVLRRCFADACYAKKINSDFEAEVSEASALLDFLTLARTTYIPEWVDEDM